MVQVLSRFLPSPKQDITKFKASNKSVPQIFQGAGQIKHGGCSEVPEELDDLTSPHPGAQNNTCIPKESNHPSPPHPGSITCRASHLFPAEAGFLPEKTNQECTLLQHNIGEDVDLRFEKYLDKTWENYLTTHSSPPHSPTHQAAPKSCMMRSPTVGSKSHGLGGQTSGTANSPGLGRGRGAGRGGPADPGGGRPGGEHPGGHPSGGGGGGPPRRLTIRTTPQLWGSTTDTHTPTNCYEKWMKKMAEIYEYVGTNYSETFNWVQEHAETSGGADGSREARICQFLAMMVVHISRKDLPGSMPDHSQIDLFNYNGDGDIGGMTATHAIQHCLSGVCFEDPGLVFNPLSHLPVGQMPPEVCLGPALVVLDHMLSHLKATGIKVDVELVYNDQPNSPVSTKIHSDLIFDVLHPAVHQATRLLHEVFLTQNAAQDLARALRLIDDDAVESFEELVCTFTVNAPAVDPNEVRNRVQTMLSNANNVRSIFAKYEAAARRTSGGVSITSATAQQVFKSIDSVADFLENNGEPDMPWIQLPQRFCTSPAQVTLGAVQLKVTHGCSRIHLPKTTTQVDEQISKIKEIVAQAMEIFREREREAGAGRGVPGAAPPPSSPSSPYPRALLNDARALCDELVHLADLQGQPVHILEDYFDKISTAIKEIQKFQWQGSSLVAGDEAVLKRMSTMKPILAGYMKDQKEAVRNTEYQSREISRNIAITNPPKLADNGSNVIEWLDYMNSFAKANPLSRCIKIKENVSASLQKRILNITDPEEMLDIIRKLYAASDVLVPNSLADVQALKSSPPINSSQEASSYAAIFSLIQKLKKMDLLDRLDYTMLQICLSKLSRQRVDEFEKSYLVETLSMKSATEVAKEERKREMFLEFIELHEALLARRMLQNSLSKEKPPIQKAFMTTRETRFEKREKKSAAASSSAPSNCPLCQAPKHPRLKPPKIGSSPASVSRCPVLRDTPQQEKLSKIRAAACCELCMSWTHTRSSCRLPADTHWLQHDCKDPPGQPLHHPSLCPYKPSSPPSERQNFTASHKEDAIIINLAERLRLKDAGGRSHDALSIYDLGSDSSWVARELANTFPKSKRQRCTLNLNTISSSSKTFKTFKHKISVTVNNQQKSIYAYEAPEIGNLHSDVDLAQHLTAACGLPIELLGGTVQFLVGLKNISLFPTPVAVPAKDGLEEVKIFKSSTRPNAFLAAGSISRSFIGGRTSQGDRGKGQVQVQGDQGRGQVQGDRGQGQVQGDWAHRQRQERPQEAPQSGRSSLFTQSELLQAILSERPIDVKPQRCEICEQKSKLCTQCQLMAKPMSIMDLKEVEMVKKNMQFNRDINKVTTFYQPNFSDFQTLFPPELSNERPAINVAKKMLKKLKKDNQLDGYQQTFEEYKKIGLIEKVTKEELEEWKECKGPINYIHHFPVAKDQAEKSEKQRIRLVVNSSWGRPTVIDGATQKASLNSVLPTAKPKLNSLHDIALRWITKPVSLLTDVQKAYNQIAVQDSFEGRMTSHVRRLIWFEDVESENPEPVIYFLKRVTYGDSVAAAILNEVIIHIGDVISDELGSPDNKKAFLDANYVDDEIVGVEDKQSAFELLDDMRTAFSKYQINLHEEVVSCKEGKIDSVGSQPRKEPRPDEDAEVKILGWKYSPFQDTLTIPINKNISKKVRGAKAGKDLTPEDVDTLTVTPRILASFNHSQFDLLNFMAPVMIQGKVLMAKVQQVLPPVCRENWDAPLPPPLAEEARDFIKMVISMTNPQLPRYPPRGKMQEIAIHMDGSQEAKAITAHAVYVEEDKTRSGRFLCARPRIARRSIPDQELDGASMAVQAAASLHTLFPDVNKFHFFLDSESVLKQLSSVNVPKCVYSNNRIREVLATVKRLTEEGVNVEFHQLRSEDNEVADRCTKFVPGAEKFIESDTWLKGPAFLFKTRDLWPVVRSFKMEKHLLEEQNETVLFSATPKSTEQTQKEKKEEEEEEGEESKYDASKDEDADGNDDEATEPRDKNVTHSNSLSPSQPVFNTLLTNVSQVRKAVRVVARIREAFKKKSFSGIKTSPTEKAEKEAFLQLCADQQKENVDKIDHGKYVTFMENGMLWSRQRWSPTFHKDLFGVDKLPVVVAHDRLGHLLLARAHRPHRSGCVGNDHAKLNLKTGRFQAFLIGSEVKGIQAIRQGCVFCRKAKIEIKAGKKSCFQPVMKPDEYKDISDGLLAFKTISLDHCGPVLVSDQPEGVNLRTRKKFHKKQILIIRCCSGSGAVRFKQVADASSLSFCQAIHTHIAEVNQLPTKIYTDQAASFVSVGKKETKKNNNNEEEDCENTVDGSESHIDSESMRKLQGFYPEIEFKACGSSSQEKNGGSESAVGWIKRYIKSVLGLKPGAPLPRFSTQGLDLLLAEATRTANDRPLAFLKEEGKILCPNSILFPRYSEEKWIQKQPLKDKYLDLEEYRNRMESYFLDAMRRAQYLPPKWRKEKGRAKPGDVIMTSRGRNKVSPIGKTEFALVEGVEEEGGKLNVRVIRRGKTVAKNIVVDARNAYLLLREDEE